MSFGVKRNDCKFYVDEENRTVVCVIPRTRAMVLRFISENFGFSDIDIANCPYGTKFLDSLELPESFKGKAVCSPDDEWDVETGMLIAFARAKNKLYTSFFKRANLFVQAIDRRLGDIIDTFNSMGLVLEDKKEGLEQQIAERLGEDEDEEE